MSFFDDVIKPVADIVDKVSGAIGNGVAAITGTFAKIGMALGEIVDRVTSFITDKLQVALGDILPDEVSRWISVLEYVIDTAAFYPGQLLTNLENAIRTGKWLDVVDVVTPAVTAAMKTGRDQARGNSLMIPEEILRSIPDENDREWIRECVQYTTLDRQDSKKFFYVWGYFRGDAEAICLIDTIVFVKVPDFQNKDVVFMTIHEIKHALQFRDIGLIDFMRQYLSEKANSRNPVSLEVDADLYACSIMPNGNPHYIGKCPVK